MELDDISDACHGTRTRRIFNQMFGEVSGSTTYEELRSAESLATAEMLDEIHLMLRTLLKVKT